MTIIDSTTQAQTILPEVSSDSLTYFVRFTPSTLNGPLDGSTLYALNSFSFDVQNPVTIGSATGGAGAGKVEFDPLKLDFTDPSLTPFLFHVLASGEHFSRIDVLGYRQDGTLAIDDSFRTAFASNLAF